jgi:hypothetical protein
MNQSIAELYQEIAQGVINSVPIDNWQRISYDIGTIGGYVESGGEYYDESNNREWITDINSAVLVAFLKLRKEMAEFNPNNEAWYSAVIHIKKGGKFNFDFDYDHLPAFSTLPDRDKWESEFISYPRPQLRAHVQDWIDGTIKDDDWEVVTKRLRELNPSATP